MELSKLFRHPQEAIPALIEDDDLPLLVPGIGYSAVAFSEGVDAVASRVPELGVIGAIIAAAIMSVLIGSWSWALFLGGGTHLGALVFDGKPGPLGTIRAVGYGLFWPGLFAAGAAAIATLAGTSPVNMVSLAALLVQVAAAFWALYTVLAALRSRHSFSWWRAIGSYLVPLVVVVLIVWVWFSIYPPGR